MNATTARTTTAVLLGATRRNNSANGNPAWTLHTDDGDLRTGSDASVGYEIDNHTGRPEHSSRSWIGQRVTFQLTRAGRVYGWSLAE